MAQVGAAKLAAGWELSATQMVQKKFRLHQTRALTKGTFGLVWRASTVERVGFLNSCRSEVDWVIRTGGAIRWTPGPEKTDGRCEAPLGFGTAKAVITSRAVTVHVSTLSTLSQELAARA